MNTLSIDLEYCFGIGKFKYDFKFEEKQSNTFLIYAPNGTMKTSLAKTFDLIAKNDEKNMPCDKIYEDLSSKYEILADGETINPDRILVINAENDTFDASSKLSSFIASKDLKSRYELIYKDLDFQKVEFIKKLKATSQSTDCESEFVGAFSESNRESFFDCIVKAYNNISDKYEKYSFRYNDIFDRKENVKKFIEKNEQILDQYMLNYKDLISNSKFFKETDGKSFGTYQANELLKSIEDNSFFEAGHKFVLEDGTEIIDSEQLKAVVEEEIKKIVNDKKLKTAFEKVDKAIGANVELRAFKRVIEKENLLLIELKDYDEFKRKVWSSFLFQLESDAKSLVDFYSSKKAELEVIISEAKKEFKLWKQIIKTFNDRFYVPFQIGLTNQEDVILKQQTASLEFYYSDLDKKPVRKTKTDLLTVLSRGERRAFFILQFLFEIESRKFSDDKNLLIFDDVADSFDYKNKYAIIEYIRDLKESDKFRIILLTHNFDFYRTVTARLYLYMPTPVFYFAIKNSRKQINLIEGFNSRNIFEDFLVDIEQAKSFVSSIAFVRNIIEFSESKRCPDYQLLTNSLHLKEASKNIKAKDVFNVYKARLKGLENKMIAFSDLNIIELILNTADEIMNEETIDEILLYNKIVLALAIRLIAEKYLRSKLPAEIKDRDHPNPTNYLYEKYRGLNPESPALNVLDNVNLMTPENIHINAFMYEPLIDMSVIHLKSLYKNVNSL
jgi:energy-coupling factor transporter ATP-binding protein EcfA2